MKIKGSSGQPVPDEMIIEYCKKMNYTLISIDKIAFRYFKPDSSEAALLKAAAWKPTKGGE